MNDWRERAGRTLMVGLEGSRADSASLERLASLGAAGVILFARNLESPEQVVELLATVGEALRLPSLFAIDQEGGRVSRLEPWIGPTPTAASLAEAGEDATRRFGRATAGALRCLGFNVDFAPVVDLCEAAATNGIADRSFGTDPERAAALAGAFLDGLQGEGVAGCLKHFPGLGPTTVDSHETLPTSTHDRRELERSDLVPFRRLADRAASVMVGHGHYPGLDAHSGRPATLAHAIVTELLRDELGFQGLVVCDDLEMGAVAPLDESGAAAVRAIEAGCDLLLYCSRLERAETAATALADRARHDARFALRLTEAASAVDRFAVRWPSAQPRIESWIDARVRLMHASRIGDGHA